MTATAILSRIDLAVARLDRWLDSMRGLGGYGGPVIHWWRDCLLFCGPGLDWRYEGIIAAYLTLYERTGHQAWLVKARRAGDDLVRGQLPNGSYRDSRFELNPGSGGTPHEAAADLGLLLLARALRADGQDDWTVYLEAAARNVESYFLSRLWSDAERRFRDVEGQPSFVPNKSATLIEALCLLAGLTERDQYLERYVRPTADAILTHQVRAPGSRLDGGIAQNTIGRAMVEKYFPYYNARCVPGLLAAYQWLGDERYLDAACAAVSFVLRWRDADGGFPQVVYGNGRINRYPRWIAATGDVLRAFDLLRPYGFETDLEPTRRWLLAGQLPNGAFRLAEGFGAQVSQAPPLDPPDARDLMPVVGWNDKAFRYLAGEVTQDAREISVGADHELEVRVGRGYALLHESDSELIVRGPEGPIYQWSKGATWASIPTV